MCQQPNYKNQIYTGHSVVTTTELSPTLRWLATTELPSSDLLISKRHPPVSD